MHPRLDAATNTNMMSGLKTFTVRAEDKRPVARHLSSKRRLNRAESDRAIRLRRLLARAEFVFEDRGSAAAWFKHPLKELGGKTPLEHCASEPGGRKVEMVLGRIEHGIIG